jgi:cell division protein FtsN
MTDRDVHEIPLSGKQLVFLFMSGVVVLVIVFLLGVSVGQGVDDVPAQTSDTSVPPDAQPTEASPADLSFHGELTGADGGVQPAALVPQPPPAEPPPPPDDPDPTTPAPGDQTGSPQDWNVQVGAYGKGNADQVMAQLTELGFSAFLATSSSDSLYRVRVGPFRDRADAEDAAARLENEGFAAVISR